MASRSGETQSSVRKNSAKTLVKISIRITTEAEEAVMALMESVFERPAAIYTNTGARTTKAVAYVERLRREQRDQLRRGIRDIRAVGLDVGSGRISVSRIARENWAESWKRHFKPLEINDLLLVLPSWSRRRPKRGQALVILDPGLSFGTGHHPTTAFCLEQIATRRDSAQVQSLLDVGCGSGIISIAAAKLGYSPVVAFDFDPDAVRVAQQNAATNNVRFSISRQDLTTLPEVAREQFDIVCANLMYDLLIQERGKIVGRLATQGTLVLAGILRQQFPAVQRAYKGVGLRLVASRVGKEWRSGAFQRS
jgi:ribosomal protein L11 methyltransferase